MNKLFSGIYQKKKVLLTGNTGFKGSWLNLWLNSMNAEVLGYSLDVPTAPSHFELLQLKSRTITGDICDFDLLQKTLHNFQPDIVFHLAAQPLVRASHALPRETFNTNIMGTVNVLETIRNTPSVKAAVLITTDKCYRQANIPQGYTEGHRLGGTSPYGVSKAGAELVIASYAESFFQKGHTYIASCRAGNVIGGGDWAKDRLIPDLIASALSGTPALIRYPQAIRPWQHVLEPLAGYLLLGQKLLESKDKFSGAWNFGPKLENNTTVQQVITQAQHSWKALQVKFTENNGPDEDTVLRLDSTKARNKLEWRPVWDSMEETVSKTIAWYRTYYETQTVISYPQLEEFITAATDKHCSWTH